MKNRILLLVSTFLLFILVFVLQKVVFMLFYHDIYNVFSLGEYVQVLLHGLQHDASIAGYLSVIPGFMIMLSFWFENKTLRIISSVYFSLIAFVIAFVFVLDLMLYQHWGFKLDSTPFFYMSSPSNALASTSWIQNILGFSTVLILTAALSSLFVKLLVVKNQYVGKFLYQLLGTFILLFEVALLFLPIRGGVKESTMNVGKVFFSNELVLNHAAVNPIFSLFYSLSLEQRFEEQYRFMPDDQAKLIFNNLRDSDQSNNIPVLFNVEKPNVIFIVLESFMSLNMHELGGMSGVAENMDSLCSEGVLFTNFYANSFRTDRALVSILSAYPAQPNMTLIKYPRKLQLIPSFPLSMKKDGYQLHYYYGGDADFTSMRSYLKICGFDDVVEDISFSSKDRTTKWGVPDHLVFNRLLEDSKKDSDTPFLRVFQTLSSHPPFDVPFRKKLEDTYLNSVAYTDSCLGDFIRNLKQTDVWKNSVVVMVPDHAMTYPHGIDQRAVDRYKIPLLMVGGALKSPMRIDTYGSQIDIAATLLHQLGIDYSEFTFSKNILNPSSPHFGVFTFQNGFGMVTTDNHYVYDYEAQNIFSNTGVVNANKLKVEAFIQTLYDDIASK